MYIIQNVRLMRGWSYTVINKLVMRIQSTFSTKLFFNCFSLTHWLSVKNLFKLGPVYVKTFRGVNSSGVTRVILYFCLDKFCCLFIWKRVTQQVAIFKMISINKSDISNWIYPNMPSYLGRSVHIGKCLSRHAFRGLRLPPACTCYTDRELTMHRVTRLTK